MLLQKSDVRYREPGAAVLRVYERLRRAEVSRHIINIYRECFPGADLTLRILMLDCTRWKVIPIIE